MTSSVSSRRTRSPLTRESNARNSFQPSERMVPIDAVLPSAASRQLLFGSPILAVFDGNCATLPHAIHDSATQLRDPAARAVHGSATQLRDPAARRSRLRRARLRDPAVNATARRPCATPYAAARSPILAVFDGNCATLPHAIHDSATQLRDPAARAVHGSATQLRDPAARRSRLRRARLTTLP
jgi:hypothetical protein